MYKILIFSVKPLATSSFFLLRELLLPWNIILQLVNDCLWMFHEVSRYHDLDVIETVFIWISDGFACFFENWFSFWRYSMALPMQILVIKMSLMSIFSCVIAATDKSVSTSSCCDFFVSICFVNKLVLLACFVGANTCSKGLSQEWLNRKFSADSIVEILHEEMFKCSDA